MPYIVSFNVFDERWQIFLRPIKSIVRKVSDFNELFLCSYSGDNMIELLELFFGEIREFIEPLDITLIELFFIMENDVVVGLIENKPPVSLLNRRVLLSVLLDIADVW